MSFIRSSNAAAAERLGLLTEDVLDRIDEEVEILRATEAAEGRVVYTDQDRTQFDAGAEIEAFDGLSWLSADNLSDRIRGTLDVILKAFTPKTATKGPRPAYKVGGLTELNHLDPKGYLVRDWAPAKGSEPVTHWIWLDFTHAAVTRCQDVAAQASAMAMVETGITGLALQFRVGPANVRNTRKQIAVDVWVDDFQKPQRPILRCLDKTFDGEVQEAATLVGYRKFGADDEAVVEFERYRRARNRMLRAVSGTAENADEPEAIDVHDLHEAIGEL